ncbi:MAG TPA: DUF2779 domain-containing protein, partial [Candidatus Paceibacterota bacterium]|nr:DUF2779 domain-containing protein [Candidatus Paceibacterota bacterium]
YIKDKKPVIFQPVFQKDGFLAAVDILEYDSKHGTYIINEVKSSNEIDEKVHFFDLAFQVNLLRRCGLNIAKINLIHLNKEYVRSGDIDLAGVFKIDNITDEINELQDQVEGEMAAAKEYLAKETEPNGYCCCITKGRSGHCTTFSHANPNVPEYSVHDIARIGSSKRKLEELIDSGIFHIKDIPEDMEFSEIQRNQIDSYIHDKVLIKKEEIKKELSGLVFPLYFLDYETYPCAIPRFSGFSPYQQIPFQYSLHVVRAQNEEPEHYEFIHVGKDDPSEHLFKTLSGHIGLVGSVIVWNKKFESKINKEIGLRIPEAASFMENVNSRIYDLMDVFSKQLYVHKDFYGSCSIKCVLPVIVPLLSYKDLEIREGGTASQSWNTITTGDITQKEKDVIVKNLLNYCELDTYAMYAIWNVLRKI